MSNFSRSIIIAGVVATAAGAGCADNVTTAIRACPCADGNVCCGSGVCAADQSACGAATAALSAQAAGDWVGYIENFTSMPFPAGSDDLKLSLRVQSDGSLGGTVTMGTGTPPPAPTDPDVGWPAGYNWSVVGASQFLIEGFEYPVASPHWEALRLRGGFSTALPWGPWCAIQTPIEAFPGSDNPYRCSQIVTAGMEDGQCAHFDIGGPLQAIDCGHWILCALADKPCTCTAAGCTVATNSDNTFDISLDGDRGDGSISLPTQGGMYNVRLLRQ